jgi:Flp pilus assembly protein TadB
MPILLIIIGLLLILFGGGCTIVFIAVDGDLEFLWLWLALGVAPLVGGFFLIRYALKLLRERREQPSGGDKS